MNEWFKKVIQRVKDLWAKGTTVQRGIFIGVVVLGLVGIVLLFTINTAPTNVAILQNVIANPSDLNAITVALDLQGLDYSVGSDGRLYAANQAQAQNIRNVLVQEGLLPQDTDPYELFDMERWTLTDFERDVNLQRAVTAKVQQHIEALEDIDRASVSLAMPEDSLFAEDQKPVTASIVIFPTPGSRIRENRKALEGIERLIQFAVDGLEPEYITINDPSGIQLNDWTNMAAIDSLELSKRELQLQRDLELQFMENIQRGLSTIFTERRVQVQNVTTEFDHGKWEERRDLILPTILREDNPLTDYYDGEFVESVLESTERFSQEQTTTGFNPGGPSGSESGVAPGYSDVEGVVTNLDRQEDVENYRMSTSVRTESGSAGIAGIYASVAIDGRWEKNREEDGSLIVENGKIQRTYIPPTNEELTAALELVEAAVGYDPARGDVVVVRHVPFDRSAEFNAEDEEYLRQQNIQLIILFSLLGLAVLLVAFVVFRLVSREIERRRRLREEELARQHQAMREAAFRSAEEESTEVEMSVEERARMELLEGAINQAREHPEDVAQLIRTWLMEE